ncbi:hypothetical protein E5676_scaffold477G00990 [Cucumis melo var. makuwa]|uniref:Mucin-19-like n=1 Tax=Cucumis melo var. makuwa TaxID=1194695 RepID=A0A5A7TM14_CUCMM|nr:hypothetical protein E6C27_scaffold795G001120 [Cucumis melo var. makuwa]TYK15507.1 hypothetical protein E5676_scaffold477G00990 [Cucumis melo var. makuwa]
MLALTILCSTTVVVFRRPQNPDIYRCPRSRVQFSLRGVSLPTSVYLHSVMPHVCRTSNPLLPSLILAKHKVYLHIDDLFYGLKLDGVIVMYSLVTYIDGWVVYLAGTMSYEITTCCASFEITRLRCVSYRITRLMCASDGITRLTYVFDGVTRLISASYGITRLMCVSYEITRLL